jgi:hypothetical protein
VAAWAAVPDVRRADSVAAGLVADLDSARAAKPDEDRVRAGSAERVRAGSAERVRVGSASEVRAGLLARAPAGSAVRAPGGSVVIDSLRPTEVSSTAFWECHPTKACIHSAVPALAVSVARVWELAVSVVRV